MLLHRYSHGRDIEGLEVSLEEAFEFLEEQEIEINNKDNFIGFTHPKHENIIIQFIRKGKRDWEIDVPIFVEGEYTGSLLGTLIHDQVFAIVLEFFNSGSKLSTSLLRNKYDELCQLCKNRWGIVLVRALS
ncbi:MAG: hypothetical protein ACXADH_16460 [Candidatus Kariarchaeaceae archaeon]|jgi:hypothetical protein